MVKHIQENGTSFCVDKEPNPAFFMDVMMKKMSMLGFIRKQCYECNTFYAVFCKQMIVLKIKDCLQISVKIQKSRLDFLKTLVASSHSNFSLLYYSKIFSGDTMLPFLCT